MTRPHSHMVGNRVTRDLEQPRRESLLVAKRREPALHSDKHVLHYVVALGRRDTRRDERTKLLGQILPGRGRRVHWQQPGSQQASAFSLPRRASIVADAMNRSAPGNHEPTISALRGAIFTSIDLNPAS